MPGATRGFAPVASRNARVLILGTLPSRKSLQSGEYYGHPRNAFWPIMATLLGFAEESSYGERKAILIRNKVALWDVLAASQRPGSLDASIESASAEVNDFQGFFERHSHVEALCFNGQTAAKLYLQRVAPGLKNGSNIKALHVLPSTSPAHAAMPLAQKLAFWRVVSDVLASPNKTSRRTR